MSLSYPRVKSVTDTVGNTFVRAKRSVGGGVIKEKWITVVTAAGSDVVIVALDRPSLLTVEVEERAPLVEQWHEEYNTIPLKAMASQLLPVTLGSHLVVDVSMPARRSPSPREAPE